MTAPPPPPPGPRGTIPALIGRVLDYMSTPWRAVVVIVLTIVLGAGFAAWQERAALLGALLAPPSAPFGRRPAALKSDLSGELDNVLAQTGAAVVAVWAVDIGANIVRFVLARRHGGGVWTFTPVVMPAILDSTDAAVLAQLVTGRSVCLDPAGRGSLVLRRLAADGLGWVCAVPAPPSQAERLLGVLLLAWTTRPEPALEAAALTLAAAAAAAMVMR